MEPDSEKGTQRKEKKQWTQVATRNILNKYKEKFLNMLNKYKEKFLPLESSSAAEQVPRKTGESAPLEMFRRCVSKALSDLV